MKTVLPLLGEYLGTFLLTLVFLSSTNPLFIGTIYAVILFLLFPISGGLLNPALSIAQYFNGKLGYRETILYIIIEIIASVSSYYTVAALL